MVGDLGFPSTLPLQHLLGLSPCPLPPFIYLRLPPPLPSPPQPCLLVAFCIDARETSTLCSSRSKTDGEVEEVLSDNGKI